jgi:hypothetical protein
MNLFRSEEHIRNWARYDPAAEEGIFSLEELVKLFTGDFFEKRLESNYVSNNQEFFGEWLSAVSEIAKTRPFWRLEPQ